MNLHVIATELEGPRLAADYVAGNEKARRFYSGDPTSLSAYAERAHGVAERFPRHEREEVARMLRATSDRAAERLHRFVEHGGVVVTTGQQTGLFIGPLYTVYKILSAVRLAAELEQQIGLTVLPVFWSASEDHDWAEVDHANLPDFSGSVHRVGVSWADERPLPTARLPLPDDFESAFDRLRDLVASERHARLILQQVRDAYSAEPSYAAGFLRLIASFFAPFDLLTVDASDPVLKRRSTPVLRDAVEHAGEAEDALNSRTAEIAKSGYAAQVAVLPGATNVFVEGEHGRARLYRDGDGWRVQGTRRVLSRDELDRILQDSPERVSPNVFLRPVVESAVLPVVAYVAGPGEISYFAQIGPLFRLHLGASAPLVVPRASFVLLRAELERVLGREGRSWRDLAVAEHHLAASVAMQELPAEAAAALIRLREALTERFSQVLTAAADLHPSLAHTVGAARNAAMLEVARVERKLLGAVRRRESSRIAKLLGARAELRPGGAPQERILNVLPFLARFGPALLRETADRIEPPWQAGPKGDS